ncbi:metal ABC transporter ATP-binding protein [Demequina sp. NBRC 110056]|uniref:metal ABC transporter ATP-binding protein n=1 Tax=Demequina sp. NBRC 110056 TaxID=1570345 RepID=UPI000A03028F|nr:ATP-binding cassette domain-containing protein [Demequina sp. NBRC 110056]
MAAPDLHATSRVSAPAVRARDVRVTLGGTEILHGVSLDAHDGEVVALMGGNGSGKSTFVRSIVGALPLAAGEIRIGGAPASAAARTALGYVPQRLSAAGGVSATVTEVVASGLLGRSHLRPPRRASARIAAALDTMGVADLAGRDVARLSGGQQQRVLIARALVREPRILVLDEPMAGVDLESQVAFAHALSHLKEDGTAIVIVLHELGALARHIDTAVVLEHGCVTYAGRPPADLGVHALPGHDHEHAHEDPEPAQSTLGLDSL